MASTDSTTNLSDVLSSLAETLANFHSESDELESEFDQLVDGLSNRGRTAINAAVKAAEPQELDSKAVKRLENIDRSIAEQRLEFGGKQDQLTNDVGQLRDIVDQQTKMFAALVESTRNVKAGNRSRKEPQSESSEDEVLSNVFAQFEELTDAAVTGGEVLTT